MSQGPQGPGRLRTHRVATDTACLTSRAINVHETSAWHELRSVAHAVYADPSRWSSEELERRAGPWLSADERRHMNGLRNDVVRHEFLATRALCRGTLARIAGVFPGDWQFGTGAHGKPAVVTPTEFASLRFNLSHSDGMIVCLVSRAGEVGVDVERTRRPIDPESIAKHFFAPVERQQLAGLPSDHRALRSYQIWVLKEAYLKGCGAGLSRSPEEFAIDVPNEGETRSFEGWQLSLHRPSDDHIAATAIKPDDYRSAMVPVIWWPVDDDLL